MSDKREKGFKEELRKGSVRIDSSNRVIAERLREIARDVENGQLLAAVVVTHVQITAEPSPGKPAGHMPCLFHVHPGLPPTAMIEILGRIVLLASDGIQVLHEQAQKEIQ